MTLDQQLKKAIEDNDSRVLSRVVDRLRFQWGLTYRAILDLACNVTGRAISPAEWDALMEECDASDVAD